MATDEYEMGKLRYGGVRIGKLLIANRGEIAVRIARSARAMGIATVGVFSDPDADAMHARCMDEAVHLPGSTPTDTYLRTDLIVDAALRVGAHAVHPGYGFLSENASFAAACLDAGLVFIGPPPAAIEAMASKVEAKRLMAAAGVPVLPGFTVDTDHQARDLEQAAAQIGFPVIVKAALGGGGRGMHVVGNRAQVVETVDQARREATSAFGDSTVFLERYIEDPRHIEVQILADTAGNVVHLFERECSIQRRHQKVIEECPSPAVDPVTRALLGPTAVAAAKAIGYVGAGTVEFVMDPDGQFYFLEVNTRLQVEHPVTEMVTGLDLVRLQIEIAAGHPLPPEATSAELRGHAIEARLYAEDVPGGFLPTSGTLDRFDVPQDSAGIRVDAGYQSGSVVSTFYDALLAKVVAWAPTRSQAASRLADTLDRARIHGPATNRPLLVRVLRHPEFAAGRTDTGFLARHDPARLGGPLYHPDAPLLHAHAATASRIMASGAMAPGWRNVGGGTAPLVYMVDGQRIEVPGRIQEFEDVEVVDWLAGSDAGAGQVVLDHLGVRRRYIVESHGLTWYVDSALGTTTLDEVERFPVPGSTLAEGSLVAPLPGSVVSVRVSPGEAVEAGQIVVTIEAMKMEHPVRAPRSGAVSEVRVHAGDQVTKGTVLVMVIDPAR